MNVFRPSAPPRFYEFLFQVILHGLDIVVGGPFQLLYPFGLHDIKVLVKSPQLRIVLLTEIEKPGQRYLAQGNEIFNFNHQTVPDQSILGEETVKLPGFMPVSSIDGRNSRKII